jgi:hypothetical protein
MQQADRVAIGMFLNARGTDGTEKFASAFRFLCQWAKVPEIANQND